VTRHTTGGSFTREGYSVRFVPYMVTDAAPPGSGHYHRGRSRLPIQPDGRPRRCRTAAPREQVLLGGARFLPWMRDVAFREDDCRVKIGYAAPNPSFVRQVVLCLHKREASSSGQKAGGDEAYLLKVLCAAADWMRWL